MYSIATYCGDQTIVRSDVRGANSSSKDKSIQ
jgi:hypothetical protein